MAAGYCLNTAAITRAEDRQHNRQCHEQNEQEQQSNTLVEHTAGDVTDGLAVVAQAHHQRAKVVHCADEY